MITMGCGDVCPVFHGRRYEHWALADPKGRPPEEEVRAVRDDIRVRVENLLAGLVRAGAEGLGASTPVLNIPARVQRKDPNRQ
ncbi:hypothetical protein I6N91_03860 [Arthrobacter sp. MSA 4-2]|uniref:hypothetical protein n=1 Tax=Arthrobacter sp. MSA 4-2 TaxID=2794349 RepID=UPI0018E81674|nr:hypothetical protein [Arthrobacter sp. MSA 4-2]MBJ2120111.1 hypothetical protein [Arthrobacter sp. MSA 4-2]